MSVIRRSVVLMALMAALVAVRARLAEPVEATTAESLGRFPMSFGAWRGTDVPLATDVVRAAAVDDYLNRDYRSSNGNVALYIGYYRSQRQGESLHSPLFCLPGSGWQPVAAGRADLRRADGSIQDVNRLIVERRFQRLMVLYWYQTLARVSSSEYARKFFLVRDAIVTRRTDVALVRVVAPLARRDAASERASFQSARTFAEAVLPEVRQRLFGPESR